jgi:hypothetical protein
MGKSGDAPFCQHGSIANFPQARVDFTAITPDIAKSIQKQNLLQ